MIKFVFLGQDGVVANFLTCTGYKFSSCPILLNFNKTGFALVLYVDIRMTTESVTFYPGKGFH